MLHTEESCQQSLHTCIASNRSLEYFEHCTIEYSPSLTSYISHHSAGCFNAFMMHTILFLPLVTKYSHYKIVVVHNNYTSNTKTEIPDDQLLPDSQSKDSYYVAAAIMVEDFSNIFLIGDGQSYTLNDKTFVNVPLSVDKEYSVFIRLYSELQVS